MNINNRLIENGIWKEGRSLHSRSSLSRLRRLFWVFQRAKVTKSYIVALSIRRRKRQAEKRCGQIQEDSKDTHCYTNVLYYCELRYRSTSEVALPIHTHQERGDRLVHTLFPPSKLKSSLQLPLKPRIRRNDLFDMHSPQCDTWILRLLFRCCRWLCNSTVGLDIHSYRII